MQTREALLTRVNQKIGALEIGLNKVDSLFGGEQHDAFEVCQYKFRMQCLRRAIELTSIASEQCNKGQAVAATLLARGVLETIGLLVLYEIKIAGCKQLSTSEKMAIVRKFVFSSRQFGEERKGVHVMDCVRALKNITLEAEELYDLLCEAVHPNWLGLTTFKNKDASEDFDSQIQLLEQLVFKTVDLALERADLLLRQYARHN